MNSRQLHQLVSDTDLYGWVLTALFALGLASVGVARAQSSGASPAATVKSQHFSSQSSARLTQREPRKGSSEGISVRGHWLIEVKNPDGKVTARREFENAIQPSGMSYLVGLLAGNNSPGPLSIVLDGGGSLFAGSTQLELASAILATSSPATPAATSGPCAPWDVRAENNPSTTIQFQVGVLIIAPNGSTQPGGPCLITAAANTSGYAGVLSSGCLLAQHYAITASGTNPPILPCSSNLTVTAPTLSLSNFGSGLAAQITLNGSVTVSPTVPPGSITDVETLYEACDTNTTATGCFGSANVQTAIQQTGVNLVTINLFTMKNLDGVGSDPQPVPYGPGQTIAATVTISFQ